MDLEVLLSPEKRDLGQTPQNRATYLPTAGKLRSSIMSFINLTCTTCGYTYE